MLVGFTAVTPTACVSKLPNAFRKINRSRRPWRRASSLWCMVMFLSMRSWGVPWHLRKIFSLSLRGKWHRGEEIVERDERDIRDRRDKRGPRSFSRKQKNERRGVRNGDIENWRKQQEEGGDEMQEGQKGGAIEAMESEPKAKIERRICNTCECSRNLMKF